MDAPSFVGPSFFADVSRTQATAFSEVRAAETGFSSNEVQALRDAKLEIGLDRLRLKASELLTAAARKHGTTVVLVTHDARVAAYADREVIVRDGKVSTLTGATP